MLYIILLVSSMMSIGVYMDNTIVYANSSTQFILQKVWSTQLTGNINVSMPIAYGDFDNDGINDVLAVNNYKNETQSLCLLSGLSGQLYGCFSLPTNVNLTGLIRVGDTNNNGRKELVISAVSVDADNNRSTVYFYLWEPYTNTIIQQQNTTVSGSLNPGYIPFATMIYRDGVVEQPFSYNTGFFASNTYIMKYEISSNTITYSIEKNKIYLMYSSILMGDIDNDGILESSDNYTVKTYWDLSTFMTTFTMDIYLEVYSGDQLLFTKHYSNTIPVFIGIGYNGEDYYIWTLIMEFNFFATSISSGIACYGLDGSSIIYETIDNAVLYGFAVLGDTIWFIYNDTSTGNIYGDLYSTIDGSRLQHIDLTTYNIVSTMGGGLGDIDNNEYKDVLIPSIDGLYLLETNGDLYRVQGELTIEPETGVSIIETSDKPYIVAPVYSDDTVNIEAYVISSGGVGDTTPPVIIISNPRNNTLQPRIYLVDIIIYDNESDIESVTAIVYNEETNESKEIDLFLIMVEPNTYEYWAYVFENVSGNYTLIVTAENSAGLTSTASVHYEVDANPPSVIIYSPSPGAIFSKKELPIKVNFSVSDDNLANWSLYVNLYLVANGTESGNYTFDINEAYLFGGYNSIWVMACDEAGNTNVTGVVISYYPGPFKFNFTVLNPEVFYGYIEGYINITYILSGYSEVETTDLIFRFYKLTFPFETLAREVAVPYEFNTTSSVLINVSDLEDGDYSLEVVIGVEGYDNYTLYSTFIMIDNYAPTLNYTIPLIDSYIDPWRAIIIDGKALVPVSIYAEDAYLDNVTVYIDGQYYKHYTPFVLSFIDEYEEIEFSEGEHQVRIVAMDKAGHSTEYTITFTLDISEPNINEFNVTVNGTSIIVYYDVSDNISGVDYVVITVNSENITSTKTLNETSGTVVFTNMTPGNYTVTIKVYDKVGLTTNTSATITIKAPTPPTTTTPPPTTTTPTPTTSPPTTSPSPSSVTSPTTSPTTTPAGGVPGTLIAAIVVVIIIIIVAIYFITKK